MFNEMLWSSRILIIDDDEDLISILTMHFQRAGFRTIESFGDGEKALEEVLRREGADNQYSLIILDLRLPGSVSGQELYHRLSGTANIPIVILTGANEKDEQIEALQTLGVEEYFTKPMDMEIFLLKCERILSRRIFTYQLEATTRRSQRLFLNVIQVMAKVLEAKDPYTKFHSQNVAKYARQIGKRIGYSSEKLEMLQIAGILHDFGKIGIKEAVLNKPGSLTEEEYHAIRRHPMIASTILEPIEELETIINDIRHHHERFDGRGYPDNLAGEQIPMGARILCVADSFDAMTSPRSYHEPMSDEEALEELQRCGGTQFDPHIVTAFIEIVRENSERRRRINDLRNRIA